jgi:hypothetical protein
MFKIFQSKKTRQQAENMKVINSKKAKNQEAVFKAVEALNVPSTGKMVSVYLGWDSASVTNRLSELCKKGRLKIAYNKRGLDGIWRHYYVVNER